MKVTQHACADVEYSRAKLQLLLRLQFSVESNPAHIDTDQSQTNIYFWWQIILYSVPLKIANNVKFFEQLQIQQIYRTGSWKNLYFSNDTVMIISHQQLYREEAISVSIPSSMAICQEYKSTHIIYPAQPKDKMNYRYQHANSARTATITVSNCELVLKNQHLRYLKYNTNRFEKAFNISHIQKPLEFTGKVFVNWHYKFHDTINFITVHCVLNLRSVFCNQIMKSWISLTYAFVLRCL